MKPSSSDVGAETGRGSERRILIGASALFSFRLFTRFGANEEWGVSMENKSYLLLF